MESYVAWRFRIISSFNFKTSKTSSYIKIILSSGYASIKSFGVLWYLKSMSILAEVGVVVVVIQYVAVLISQGYPIGHNHRVLCCSFFPVIACFEEHSVPYVSW